MNFGRSRFLRTLGTLTLLAAVPYAGWSASSEPPAYPPEALRPNDDARALFEVLPSRILTDDPMAQMPPEQVRPVDAVIEQSLTRGERVPNWQTTGVDLRAVVGARAGGTAGNVLTRASQFGLDVTYFDDARLDTFIPAGLVLIARRGEPVSGEIIQVEIGHLSPKVILAERIAYRREGNAYCRVRAETRLYSDPSVPASEVDSITVMMTMRYLPAIDRLGLCGVVEARGSNGYVTRAFDAEGNRLPALDEAAGIFQIVPRESSGDQPPRR